MKYFLHKTAIIDENCSIGEGTKVWHWTHISRNVSIGKNCIIGQNVFIGEGVNIGNNVKIQNNVSVYSGVKVFDDVFIGPSVVFTNINIPRSFKNQKKNFISTKLKKGCSIGANTTVICGNSIGEYSFIGAGSVITKNVKKYDFGYGSPYKSKGTISKNGSIKHK